ncbi:MAG: MarR family transcriptional regulator [Candidatus Omnitrophica bacterium]|nr:MarR family transcriptional regulator [Candidatus Omnitrophota bacterium]
MTESMKEFQKLFREIQFKFSRFFTRMFSSEKLSVPQIFVLAQLFREGDLPMNQLAKYLGITRPAVTNLIDRLVKEDYVERIANSDDRRVILARLKKKGRDIVGKLEAKWVDFLTKTVSKFSRSEQDTIRDFYRSLSKSIDELL